MYRASGFFVGVLLSCSCLTSFAQAPRLVWAQVYGASGDQQGAGVSVDPQSHLFLSGYFDTQVTLETETTLTVGKQDLFLARLGTDGNVIWTRFGGSAQRDVLGGVATGPPDAVYLGISSGGEMTLGADLFTSGMVIAAYSTDGQLRWTHQPKSVEGSTWLTALSSDTQGNVFVTGYVSSSANFGPFELVSEGGHSLRADLFIAKYDGTGTPQWGVLTGTLVLDELGLSIANDPAGNVYVLGFSGVNFAGLDGPCSSNDRRLALLVGKHDSTGQAIWGVCEAVGEPFIDLFLNGIAVDAAGNTYIAGSNINLDADDVSTSELGADQQVVLVKLMPTGKVAWRVFGQGRGQSVILDSSGRVHLLKQYGTEVALEGYSAEGTLLYTLPLGISVGQGNPNALMAIDETNHLYVTGTLNGSTTIQETTLVSNAGEDVFLAKFDLSTVGVNAESAPVSPGFFRLGANYPNPFSTYTDMPIVLSAASELDVRVYDLLGRERAVVFQGFKSAGHHLLHFKTGALPDGIYFYQARAGSFLETRRFVLKR